MGVRTESTFGKNLANRPDADGSFGSLNIVLLQVLPIILIVKIAMMVMMAGIVTYVNTWDISVHKWLTDELVENSRLRLEIRNLWLRMSCSSMLRS